MLDTQNGLQNHIKYAKVTKFLLQSAVYISKGSTCKGLPFYDFWFKFCDTFCSPYPIVDFLRIFRIGNRKLKFPYLLSQLLKFNKIAFLESSRPTNLSIDFYIVLFLGGLGSIGLGDDFIIWPIG